MPVKICHITSAHNSHDNRILEKECVSLAKIEEFDVYLLARGKSEIYKNVNIVGVGNEKCGRIKRLTKIIRELYKEALRVDADIYHIHDPELLFIVKKLKLNGKSVIFDSHELYKEQIKMKDYIPRALRGIICKIYDRIEDKACRYLDAVVFPCPVNGKHPFENKIKKCVFLNNYPVIEELESLDVNKESFKGNDFTVCCLGSLTPERGIENLIMACKNAKVRLILGGEISPTEFKKKILETKNYKDVLDYRGVCNREQVLEIYKESDIGASTILDNGQYAIVENFPTKVYEFMMAQLPFIISDFPYAKKIMNKLKCGICINPNDVEDITKGIIFLHENTLEAKKMGLNGRKAAKELYNWGVEERKLYMLYNDVIDN